MTDKEYIEGIVEIMKKRFPLTYGDGSAQSRENAKALTDDLVAKNKELHELYDIPLNDQLPAGDRLYHLFALLVITHDPAMSDSRQNIVGLFEKYFVSAGGEMEDYLKQHDNLFQRITYYLAEKVEKNDIDINFLRGCIDTSNLENLGATESNTFALLTLLAIHLNGIETQRQFSKVKPRSPTSLSSSAPAKTDSASDIPPPLTSLNASASAASSHGLAKNRSTLWSKATPTPPSTPVQSRLARTRTKSEVTLPVEPVTPQLFDVLQGASNNINAMNELFLKTPELPDYNVILPGNDLDFFNACKEFFDVVDRVNDLFISLEPFDDQDHERVVSVYETVEKLAAELETEYENLVILSKQTSADYIHPDLMNDLSKSMPEFKTRLTELKHTLNEAPIIEPSITPTRT